MRTTLGILFTILLPIVLLLGSVRLLMTEAYLSIQYNRPDFPRDDVFSQQERRFFGGYGVRYLLNGEDISYLRNLRFPDTGTQMFNERELSHMIDVKIVAQYAMLALVAGIVIAEIIGVILARTRDGRAVLRRSMFSAGMLTLMVIFGLLFYVLVDFDYFFDSFHSLFFAEGSWQFFTTDSLIRLYPITFWQDSAIVIGVLWGLSGVISMIIAVVWARWENREQRSNQPHENSPVQSTTG